MLKKGKEIGTNTESQKSPKKSALYQDLTKKLSPKTGQLKSGFWKEKKVCSVGKKGLKCSNNSRAKLGVSVWFYNSGKTQLKLNCFLLKNSSFSWNFNCPPYSLTLLNYAVNSLDCV